MDKPESRYLYSRNMLEILVSKVVLTHLILIIFDFLTYQKLILYNATWEGVKILVTIKWCYDLWKCVNDQLKWKTDVL